MTAHKISIFGDEIAADLETQLKTMHELAIPFLDLRAAWGTNVLRLTDDEARRVKTLCDDYNVQIACLGSPVGKSPLADPIETEANNVHRLIEICQIVGTNKIRIFSFYPDDISTNSHYDQYVNEVIDRLGTLAEIADEGSVTLLHENEKAIVGDIPERCLKLMAGVDSPHMRFIWDPANFVQCGVANQVDIYWDILSPYIGYVHIKDARLADGAVKVAGEGDGQMALLLRKLAELGYDDVYALEPHLKVAGHSSGFSGADGAKMAVKALRDLLVSI